jgi:hypothetical protein
MAFSLQVPYEDNDSLTRGAAIILSRKIPKANYKGSASKEKKKRKCRKRENIIFII